MTGKIIFFELNEVPWRVVDDYVAERPQSQLARVLPSARQFRTRADDTALSPWITWPTVHRGVSDEEHTISDFGQNLEAIDAEYPNVWTLLARSGISTGVCGSFHSYPMPRVLDHYAFYLPDVFAAGSECFPEQIEPFQDFNLRMSRESARNVSTGIPWKPALRLLASLPGLGIRPGTAIDVGRQLVDERRRDWVKVRRRTYQPLLAFDVFMRQLRKTQPRFATFFTNHVASSMHRYWAARYPGDYSDYEMREEWRDRYAAEISWVMDKFDRMLGELLRFLRSHPEYELWLVSSMGQAATEAQTVQTQVQLDDVERFMSFLGFSPDEWERRPAMLPRVILQLREDRSAEFARKLSAIEIGDRGPLPFKELARHVFRIHPGTIFNLSDNRCSVDGAPVPFEEMGFTNLPIQDAVGCTAYHVREGSLIVLRNGGFGSQEARPEISTLDIAPTLLDRFGVTPPAHMRGSVLS